jgi:hypothetical protein
MSRLVRLLLALPLLGVLASSAQAQVTGLPVKNGGVTGGLTIGGEVGFPGDEYGGGTA